VTVILTNMAEVEILERTIRNYERATGVLINWEKFHALPVGAWDVSRLILTIPCTIEVKLWGIRFDTTVENSVHSTWTAVANTKNSSARDLYLRNLCLHQRVQVVHTHLLSKLCYVAQLLPIPAQFVRQITTVKLW
jgi:hypothetical protein